MLTVPISTRDLSNLPPPSNLERLCKTVALLDAILSPEWEYRYFSFNSNWDSTTDERMASMRNGSGDQYFAVFSALGAFIKGFAHEAPMSPWAREQRIVWPGVLDSVPDEFMRYVEEPAFEPEATTFCIWRRAQDGAWSLGAFDYPPGADPDGSAELLWMFDGQPSTYMDFARDYFTCETSLKDVASVYALAPLRRDLAMRLNPDCDWDKLLHDANEIGYPLAAE